MSDLSRLLDDVYNSTPAAEPSWSSDAALEDVFADWVPGLPADASPAERAFHEEGGAHGIEHLLDADDDDDQLQTLLDQAARFAPLVDVPDDDIDDFDDVEAPAPLGASNLMLVPMLDDEAPAPTVAHVPFVAPTLIDPDFIAPVPVHAWCRQDDDILPRGRRRRVNLSLSRR